MKEISLTSKKCTPCQGGIPPIPREVAEKFLTEVSGWGLRDDATRLKRTFKFSNFVEALCLAQHVGELCEKEGHHAWYYRLDHLDLWQSSGGLEWLRSQFSKTMQP